MRPTFPLVLWLTACAQAPATSPLDDGTAPVDGGCGCSRFGAPAQVGTAAAVLVELSGLVASHSQSDVFFAHNDSGDSARIFAMHLDGTVLQTFALSGATNVDWEDIGLGPCPAGTCVVVGDIGDNAQQRTSYALYRVAEPVVGGPSTLSAERFVFTYPDGSHNAEALFVAPSGVVYVITKTVAGPSTVYRLTLTGSPLVAERVATLKVPAAGDSPLTGADLSPCGDVIALRLYNRLVKLTVPPGQPLEAAFLEDPVPLPAATEVQSEAVAFTADGLSLVTASETVTTAAPIWRSDCR